jgi:very-short-patch-repair endonuclease
VSWELFRSHVLEEQGWELRRIWSPSLFRDHLARIEEIRSRHQAIALESRVN